MLCSVFATSPQAFLVHMEQQRRMRLGPEAPPMEQGTGFASRVSYFVDKLIAENGARGGRSDESALQTSDRGGHDGDARPLILMDIRMVDHFATSRPHA